MKVRPRPPATDSTMMSRSGLIGFPHQGQFVSWAGVPLVLPCVHEFLFPFASRIASSLCDVQLGVALAPTHNPILNGSVPQTPSFSRLMISAAQIRAELTRLEVDPGELNEWQVLKRTGEFLRELDTREAECHG